MSVELILERKKEEARIKRECMLYDICPDCGSDLKMKHGGRCIATYICPNCRPVVKTVGIFFKREILVPKTFRY